ncbi:CopD family protein [Thiomicrorhabdus sp. Kp2]|uniref:CopD family protein n=1 Tax=Thiomicrorhabdus sp. Kp2 TaxID=1123518 RepID=UPI000427C861|nr:CopD family protein [Thiomicrorhabdus sp. Kp2]
MSLNVMSFIDQLAIALHSLTAVLWVGGIFLAYRILRPAAMTLEPPIRLRLWVNVFSRFFPWVWLFIIVLVVTGYWDWSVSFGALETTPFYIHAMQIIGWVMIILFAWLYFVPFAKFKQLVADENFPLAGAIMNNQMRPIIAINLSLGVIEVIIGAAGPFWGI